jgi:hypothetical protein
MAQDELTDGACMVLAQQGDRNAFTTLVRRYQDRVYERITARRNRRPPFAERRRFSSCALDVYQHPFGVATL